MTGTLGILDTDFRPAALVPEMAPTAGQTAEPRLHVLILSKRELIIGRDTTCDHTLGSVEVSRRHARLTLEDGLWYIHDLGSTNGIFVQGARLTPGEKVVLADQFEVDFGPPDMGHFKYAFHVAFDPALQSCARLPSPGCVDTSGYKIVPTQDYNSSNQQLKAEIRRLKLENSHLETQLKQEKDHNRLVWCDLRKLHQTLLAKEATFKKKLKEVKKKTNKSKKKKNKLDGLINQYRRLSIV